MFLSFNIYQTTHGQLVTFIKIMDELVQFDTYIWYSIRTSTIGIISYCCSVLVYDFHSRTSVVWLSDFKYYIHTPRVCVIIHMDSKIAPSLLRVDALSKKKSFLFLNYIFHQLYLLRVNALSKKKSFQFKFQNCNVFTFLLFDFLIFTTKLFFWNNSEDIFSSSESKESDQ